jgi:hypothetical protein
LVLQHFLKEGYVNQISESLSLYSTSELWDDFPKSGQEPCFKVLIAAC